MVAVNDVLQLVGKKGGSYAAITLKLEPGKINKWKKRMLCYLARIEPYYLKCIKDGPFHPKTVESLPEKWLTFSQRLRNDNHTQTLDLLDIYEDYKAKYKKMKAKLALLEVSPSSSQNPKSFQPKNKGLVAETFNWDEEEVSGEEEVTRVKGMLKEYNWCQELSVQVCKVTRERIPDISYFHVFGCPVFIHNHKDHLGKFDAKDDDGYFLGYSSISKAFRFYNTRRQQIEETYHVTFNESTKAIKFTNTLVNEIGIDDSSRYPLDEFQEDDPSRQYQVDSDVSYYIIPHGRLLTKITQENHVPENDQMITQPTDSTLGNHTEGHRPITEPLVPDVTQSHIPNQASANSHPDPQDRWSRDQHIKLVNIIGNPGEGMLTRSMAVKLTAALASECLFANFLSEIEPKKVSESLKHPGWIDAMQEELNQFYRNKVWTIVALPYGKIAIGSKWVFRNKKDKHDTTTKNKARLVAQGYSQEEGIDYDETFTPMARIEAIRIFLAFATYVNFKVYQMDFKSAFLNGKLKEEVYVKQPPGFESSEFPDYVCKLDKALYGLKQAPRACLKLMTKKFEMSMMGELTYFLGLQIKQGDKEISIFQEQYTRNLLKKYEISNSSLVKTPMVPPNNLDPDLAGKPVNETSYRGIIESLMYLTVTRPGFDLKGYSDSDFVGCNIDRKITSCSCQILGGKLVCGVPRNSSQWLCPQLKLNMLLLLGVVQVLGGNYSFTEQVNSIQQLLAYSLITGTDVDIGEIISSDLVTKLLNKSRLKYVSYPRFISCALQVLLGSKYTLDKKFGFLPPILSNFNFTKDQSKVIDIELTAHIIAVNNRKGLGVSTSFACKAKERDISDYLESDIQLASTGLPFILDEGTRTSKPLPEIIVTHFKDSGEIKQPLDRDITSTTPNEGMTKTMPRPEGSLGDKDSGGNIPPTDMELLHTPVANPSGTGAKYHVDENHSTRLRCRSLTKNKGKTSSEVEPDTEPLQLHTFADIQAFLLFEDELEKESDEKEVLAARDDMDKDLQDDAKASIEKYYEENIAHRDQTDQLVASSISSLNKSSSSISDLYKGLNVITEILKDINNAVKDDHATNKKIDKDIKTFAEISTQTTEIISLVKTFDFSTLQSAMQDLQAHAFKQEEAPAAWTKSSTNIA
nr:retrovirus-related Pol polyprotein from transposon TNT 1-94 [Tanacetum cinerariifolium]